jgi:hypothetical protein
VEIGVVVSEHAEVVISRGVGPLESERGRAWDWGFPRQDVDEDVGEDHRGHAGSREGREIDDWWRGNNRSGRPG